jgi:hypothetical protein
MAIGENLAAKPPFPRDFAASVFPVLTSDPPAWKWKTGDSLNPAALIAADDVVSHML